MFKKKYRESDLTEIAMVSNPWYPPTPTTVVVSVGYGTTSYNVKEETDHLIGRLKDATVWHDDDKFLACLEVDDYTADQVWIRVDQIVAIIKNKRGTEADD